MSLLILAAVVIAYWLGCAYCDQSKNVDGSYGSWPFKNRGRLKASTYTEKPGNSIWRTITNENNSGEAGSEASSLTR